MPDVAAQLKSIQSGDKRALARAISLVENHSQGAHELLRSLPNNQHIPIIGITGPPGAGKSTITDRLLDHYLAQGLKVGVLAIDPSSPFHLGAILGDRIRMNRHYLNPNVFIRSAATRGSLGGLSDTVIEITDVMRAFPFDMILVETVGVGQSEVEIAGLADTTIVVLVPDTGDEIQMMKAGLLEVADIFVVNKADLEGSQRLTHLLRKLVESIQAHEEHKIPVIPVAAAEHRGIDDLVKALDHENMNRGEHTEKRIQLLARKAYQLIRAERMKDVSTQKLAATIRERIDEAGFNLYGLADEWGGSKM